MRKASPQFVFCQLQDASILVLSRLLFHCSCFAIPHNRAFLYHSHGSCVRLWWWPQEGGEQRVIEAKIHPIFPLSTPLRIAYLSPICGAAFGGPNQSFAFRVAPNSRPLPRSRKQEQRSLRNLRHNDHWNFHRNDAAYALLYRPRIRAAGRPGGLVWSAVVEGQEHLTGLSWSSRCDHTSVSSCTAALVEEPAPSLKETADVDAASAAFDREIRLADTWAQGWRFICASKACVCEVVCCSCAFGRRCNWQTHLPCWYQVVRPSSTANHCPLAGVLGFKFGRASLAAEHLLLPWACGSCHCCKNHAPYRRANTPLVLFLPASDCPFSTFAHVSVAPPRGYVGLAHETSGWRCHWR